MGDETVILKVFPCFIPLKIEWVFSSVLIKITYTLLRLVWHNYPSPLDSIPCQLFYFSKSRTSHIFHYLEKILQNLSLNFALFIPTSHSKRFLSNSPCLDVCTIIWALLFLWYFYCVLFSLFFSITSSFRTLFNYLIFNILL